MTSRLNLVISDDLKDALDRVSEETGQDIEGTILKAFMLYLAARDQTKSGELVLGLVDPSTKQMTTEIINLFTPISAHAGPSSIEA